LLAFARALRHGQTSSEGFVWELLRNRRFRGLKFRRQHPIDPFIVDFFCESLAWVIEIDGGQHNTTEARRYDIRRTAFLEEKGLFVSRFWSHEVLGDSEAFVAGLWGLAEQRRSTLTPALSPRERESEAAAGSTGAKKE
jgi:adenine-specific DNA-methyltransferase